MGGKCEPALSEWLWRCNVKRKDITASSYEEAVVEAKNIFTGEEDVDVVVANDLMLECAGWPAYGNLILHKSGRGTRVYNPNPAKIEEAVQRLVQEVQSA